MSASPSVPDTDDGAPNAETAAADAPPPSASDRTAPCSGCKKRQRPGFLCPDCGTLVRFPKPSGQSNWIPY